MSDAVVLSPLNHVSDLESAGDFEKKHTPYITVERVGDRVRIGVKVGHYVAHPNEPDHFIQWIDVSVAGNSIARFDLSAVATDPDVSVVAVLAPDTTVRAVESCNLHGLWAAEVTV
jgi:superoxide reductase